MSIEKDCLSLAAEYAVAAELCRRNMYAQLTFGNRKRTDILLEKGNNTFARIEVKAKQKKAWPNCKGIYGKNIFIVFVDFFEHDLSERPDFYILNTKEWLRVVKTVVQEKLKKDPKKRIEINSENIPIFLDEIDKYGKPYKGLSIGVQRIQKYIEAWSKIEKVIPDG